MSGRKNGVNINSSPGGGKNVRVVQERVISLFEAGLLGLSNAFEKFGKAEEKNGVASFNDTLEVLTAYHSLQVLYRSEVTSDSDKKDKKAETLKMQKEELLGVVDSFLFRRPDVKSKALEYAILDKIGKIIQEDPAIASEMFSDPRHKQALTRHLKVIDGGCRAGDLITFLNYTVVLGMDVTTIEKMVKIDADGDLDLGQYLPSLEKEKFDNVNPDGSLKDAPSNQLVLTARRRFNAATYAGKSTAV